MHLYSSTAFIECLYIHYDQRLQDPYLPADIKDYFLQRQLDLANQYALQFLPLHRQLFFKLLNISRMQNPHAAPLNTDAILRMAKVIEKRITKNETCHIQASAETIIVTNDDGCLIAFVKNKA